MNKTKAKIIYIPLLGWILALLIPGVLFWYLQNSHINWACLNFVIIFAAALLMWIFRLVPEYAPAIFMILATMLLGLAPQHVLLSGFSSDSFFLALSVFGIGAVVVKSKLFYRLSLLTITHLPKNQFVLRLMLFLLGALLTPFMTAQSARVSLIAPLVEDMRRSAGIKPYSLAANSLANAAFNGCILLSIMFLTGKSSNFVLYGMLSEQTQWQFGWLNWLIAASIPGVMMMIAYLFLSSLHFQNKEKLIVDVSQVKKELKQIGPLNLNEFAAIFSVIGLIAGLSLSSWHQIPGAWLAFGIFFILITSGVLNKSDFKNGINWPFLFYLGAIIGIMRCVQEIGLDDYIIHSLAWLADIMDDNQYVFISFIYILSWFGGLLFGTMAAPALMFTIFLPLAQNTILSSWLVAFIILMATEAWVFPYQSSYFICYEEQLRPYRAYRLKPTLVLNAYFSILRLVIILTSVPIWHYLNIL